MLKLLRIDDRLIHGQVAFSWVNATGVNRIIVGNDKYATNSMLKMSLMIGKPPQVDLKVLELSKAIESLKDNNNEKTMLIVQNIQDALAVCKECDDVNDVCIGGVRDGESKKLVHSQVYLGDSEIAMVKEILALGKNVFAQDVPISKKLSNEEIIEKYNESR